jgi:hypothetical protein
MFSLLRTFKLFRLVRCQRYLKKIEQYLAFNPAYMRLFTMLAALLIGWHWLGCLWWLVATNSFCHPTCTMHVHVHVHVHVPRLQPRVPRLQPHVHVQARSNPMSSGGSSR